MDENKGFRTYVFMTIWGVAGLVLAGIQFAINQPLWWLMLLAGGLPLVVGLYGLRSNSQKPDE
jgi:hypothetical protein